MLKKQQVSFSSLIATLIATLGFAAAGNAAAAGPQAQAEAYMGANVGLYSKYDISCSAGQKCDKTASFGGKIFGGVMYEQWGVEALAFGTGKGEGTLKQGGKDAQGSVKMGGLGVVGVLPLNFGDFSLKGKLGAAYTHGTASYKSGASDSKNSIAPLFGAGLGYALNKQVSLTADVDHISAKYNKAGDKAAVNMFSIGASYKF
ncbi:outer membrane beta-barrel protein [Roseateles oligotrophus]|uniref:Outer membrane beta-barrel protein n=1 Tax=Roseateles oligotrophus TaxID=1769250 RepID=A0ABT2YE53_9BURK|nr:outer membrane beta-barrel protein [Roseateles oligotrophus]MCV2368332.1 outer membrane beta-barrel protein [Roseateles oligotrophus]